MLRNYFVVALRNLLRNRAQSIINILSLSVGMAICLTICQYLYIEFNYDTFHNNFQNTYRIVVDESKPDGEPYPYPYETGYAVGVTAKAEIPEIKQYVRVHKYSGGAVVSKPDKTKIFTEDALNIYFVDKGFLDVFDFPLSHGTKEAAFNDKFNVVITERTAQKYFGTSDVVGNVLSLDGGVSPGSYTVTGILKDLPVNSHLQFDFLLPVENYMEFGWGGAATKNDNGWTSPDFATYVTLEGSANVESVRGKMEDLIVKNISQRSSNKKISLQTGLQPISEIHLHSNPNVDQSLVTNSGNLISAKFFSIIACFILIVAWVNYINLSTAHSIHRSKEVGIRKSIGAFRRQLVSQFMIESFTTNMVSAVLSLGFFSLFLPVLSEIVDMNLKTTLFEEPMFWVLSIAVISMGSILSGLFPAFVLSSFKPISMLGAYKVDKSKGFNLRRALITFQFLISLFLMAGTYLVYKQITFMKSQEMGMEVEKILVLKGPEVNLDRSKL
ncbi:MAG TPA: ABC transporter permease, partial [Chryseolinea sp.]|nr:ABC transporter permease [Chryseolinea sp.]